MERDNTYRIVVGADGSELGDVAVLQALEMARERSPVDLHAVHVATDEEIEDAPGSSRLEKQDYLLGTLPQALWDRLDRLATQMSEPPGTISVSVHVRFGPPAEVVHQVAVDYDADIIVVGTHGRQGMERLILGSVAEKLVRIAHCPVLVARPNDLHQLEKTDRVAPPGEASAAAGKHRKLHLYVATREMDWTGRPSKPPGMRMF
jgi:nucleotide-binding universal stress UspA family protein